MNPFVRMFETLVSAAIAATVLLLVCHAVGDPPAAQPPVNAPAAPPAPAAPAAPGSPANEDLPVLVRGNMQFTCDLYRELSAGIEGNYLYAPCNLSTALAMTWAGARGETARQMADVLHLDLPQERLHPAFHALTERLRSADSDVVQVKMANRLWLREDYQLQAKFLDLVKRDYGGGVQLLDFDESAKAGGIINDWVAQETGGRIKDLISSGFIHKQTRLILTSATYFRGPWANQFPKTATRDEPFHLADGTSVDVPLMHSHEMRCQYLANDVVQAVRMPYQGGRLAMIVLMPKAGKDLASLEAALKADSLASWLGAMRSQSVMVALPRFRIESGLNLVPTLGTLGMSDAFSDAADFSGMSGTRELFIDKVVHKAFIDVNEEGTEAAAATAVSMAAKGAAKDRWLDFRADRPFVFMIVDHEPGPAGTVLFIGRVMNPKG